MTKRIHLVNLFLVLRNAKTANLDALESWEFAKFRRQLEKIVKDRDAIMKQLIEDYKIEFAQDGKTILHQERPDTMKFIDVVDKSSNEDIAFEPKKFLGWDKFTAWANQNNLSFEFIDLLADLIVIPKEIKEEKEKSKSKK